MVLKKAVSGAIGLAMGLMIGEVAMHPDTYMSISDVVVSRSGGAVQIADKRKHRLTDDVTVQDLRFYDETGTGYPTVVLMKSCDRAVGECSESRVLIRDGPGIAHHDKGIYYFLVPPQASIATRLQAIFESSLENYEQKSLCGRFFVPVYRSSNTQKSYPLDILCRL
jgi:hypothetical protein